MQDFKECLDDLEEQVSDFTEEIQQLVTCTSDTTSLEVRGERRPLCQGCTGMQQHSTAMMVGALSVVSAAGEQDLAQRICPSSTCST